MIHGAQYTGVDYLGSFGHCQNTPWRGNRHETSLSPIPRTGESVALDQKVYVIYLLEMRDNTPRARPATDTPREIELARRLNLLTDAEFTADCANSTSPIIKRLLLWGGVAIAAWILIDLSMP